MKSEEHSRRSWEVLRADNPLVHEWLDQYFRQFGPAHRILLHHKRGIDLLCRELGEDARPVALLHVRDDWMGYLPADPLEIAKANKTPVISVALEIIAELRKLYAHDFGLEIVWSLNPAAGGLKWT